MKEFVECPRCGHPIKKSWTWKNIFPRVECTPLGGHILFPKPKVVDGKEENCRKENIGIFCDEDGYD